MPALPPAPIVDAPPEPSPAVVEPLELAAETSGLLELPPDDPATMPRARRAASADPADLSSLLQHHREMQDTLSDDLASMATQLKLNSLHFQSSLQADKEVMEQAETRIGGNLVGMKSQGGRLGAYRKKGGTTTCFIILALVGVIAAWSVMFAIIRLT